MNEPTTVIPSYPGPSYPGRNHGSPQWGPPAAPPPPAPRRRTGLVVGIVVGVLVLLAGLAVAAFVLFAPRQLNTVDIQNEIVRVTQEEVAVAPVEVRCPEDIPVAAGTTTTCTATLDGQPLSYGVRQDDDRGNLTITHDRTLLVAEVEGAAAAQLTTDVGEDIVVACGPEGRTVLVNAAGAPIDCSAVNVADPSIGADVVVTVDAEGTVAYEVL